MRFSSGKISIIKAVAKSTLVRMEIIKNLIASAAKNKIKRVMKSLFTGSSKCLNFSFKINV
jgi:hypothetical protein